MRKAPKPNTEKFAQAYRLPERFPHGIVLVFSVAVGQEAGVNVGIFAEFLFPFLHLFGTVVTVFARGSLQFSFQTCCWGTTEQYVDYHSRVTHDFVAASPFIR